MVVDSLWGYGSRHRQAKIAVLRFIFMSAKFLFLFSGVKFVEASKYCAGD